MTQSILKTRSMLMAFIALMFCAPPTGASAEEPYHLGVALGLSGPGHSTARTA
jgi:hypothetical protein